MKRYHFLEGFLLGAIAGIIGGILFAPSSGSETRQKLKKLKNDFAKNPKEKTEEVMSKTRQAIETGLQNIGKMIHKSEEKEA